jgi:hypothetical protein
VIATIVESARRDWEEGYRRFLEQARHPAAAESLRRQVDVVRDELRRRVGGRFSLAELAAAYERSEAWAHVAVSEHAPSRGWERDLAVVSDAAFHLYSRGAVDFSP